MPYTWEVKKVFCSKVYDVLLTACGTSKNGNCDIWRPHFPSHVILLSRFSTRKISLETKKKKRLCFLQTYLNFPFMWLEWIMYVKAERPTSASWTKDSRGEVHWFLFLFSFATLIIHINFLQFAVLSFVILNWGQIKWDISFTPLKKKNAYTARSQGRLNYKAPRDWTVNCLP